MADSETPYFPYHPLVDDDSSTDLATQYQPISTGFTHVKAVPPIKTGVPKIIISPSLIKKNFNLIKLEKPIKTVRNRSRHIEPIRTVQIKTDLGQPIRADQAQNKLDQPIRTEQTNRDLGRPFGMAPTKLELVQPFIAEQSINKGASPVKNELTKDELGQTVPADLPRIDVFHVLRADQTTDELSQPVPIDQRNKESAQSIRASPSNTELCQDTREDKRKTVFGPMITIERMCFNVDQTIVAGTKRKYFSPAAETDKTPLKLRPPINTHLSTKSNPATKRNGPTEDSKGKRVCSPIKPAIKSNTREHIDQAITADTGMKNVCPEVETNLTPPKVLHSVGFPLSPTKRNSTSATEEINQTSDCSAIIEPATKQQDSTRQELPNIPPDRSYPIQLKVTSPPRERQVHNDSGNANFRYCYVHNRLNETRGFGEQTHFEPLHRDEWIKAAEELSPDVDLWFAQMRRDHEEDHTEQPSLTVVETEKVVDSLYFENTSSRATVLEETFCEECCYLNEADFRDFSRVRSLNLESINSEQWRRYVGERMCRERTPLSDVHASQACFCSHGNGCFWQRPDPPAEASVQLPKLPCQKCVHCSDNGDFFCQPLTDTGHYHATIHNPFLNECPGHTLHEPDFTISPLDQFVAHDALMTLAKARFFETLAGLTVDSAEQVVMLKPEDIIYFDNNIKPFTSSNTVNSVRSQSTERKSPSAASLLDRGDVAAEDVAIDFFSDVSYQTYRDEPSEEEEEEEKEEEEEEEEEEVVDVSQHIDHFLELCIANVQSKSTEDRTSHNPDLETFRSTSPGSLDLLSSLSQDGPLLQVLDAPIHEINTSKRRILEPDTLNSRLPNVKLLGSITFPESENLTTYIPESENQTTLIPDSENQTTNIPESENQITRILDSENLTSHIPESDNPTSHIPESEIVSVNQVPDSPELGILNFHSLDLAEWPESEESQSVRVLVVCGADEPCNAVAEAIKQVCQSVCGHDTDSERKSSRNLASPVDVDLTAVTDSSKCNDLSNEVDFFNDFETSSPEVVERKIVEIQRADAETNIDFKPEAVEVALQTFDDVVEDGDGVKKVAWWERFQKMKETCAAVQPSTYSTLLCASTAGLMVACYRALTNAPSLGAEGFREHSVSCDRESTPQTFPFPHD